MPHADLMRMEEPPPEMQPHLAKPPRIDEREAFLTTLFLRRYVTLCANRMPRAAPDRTALPCQRGALVSSNRLLPVALGAFTGRKTYMVPTRQLKNDKAQRAAGLSDCFIGCGGPLCSSEAVRKRIRIA